MNTKESDFHISTCRQRIEASLGWGHSNAWTNYDFSKLSDEVHKRTQVRLSVTTLKRVWGRLKYENDPALTTLNALAQFAGFSDWRHFCRDAPPPKADPISQAFTTIEPAPKPMPSQRLNGYWPVLFVLLLIPIAWNLIASKKKGIVSSGEFEFRANKMVVEGVPNSVVFHYDASKARTDSVFIVQTWDIRRKKLVSRTNHEHSAMYYYPGFFRTKLIADGQIVKTHDLWITSDGWLALVEQDPIPLYFKKEEFLFPDRVEVEKKMLADYNLPLHPEPPRIRFFNQRDLGDLANDNFIFETKLKNEFSAGTAACQLVQVLIQCKDDIIIIPLGAKVCIGEMQLYFCGANFPATDADLSAFGCDLNQWTNLRVEAVDKQVTISVNGTKAYALTFPNNPTGIVGVQYRFNGVGAVKDTWFENHGERIPLD